MKRITQPRPVTGGFTVVTKATAPSQHVWRPVQIVLALDKRDVAVCSICKVSAHDKHLRIFDDITRERAVRCSRAWFVRIPFDPFKSRHRKDINVVISLELLIHRS